MPPKNKFTREQVIAAAVELTRKGGIEAVTARGLAAALGTSAKPIFGLFDNMEAVQRAVLEAAYALFQQHQAAAMAQGEYPPYKASGMAYIQFAEEEPQLFRLLYMRDRSGETVAADESVEPLIALIRRNTGLSDARARMLHLELWIFVHGIASMIVTGYLPCDWPVISAAVTDAYEGIRLRLTQQQKEESADECH